MDDSRSKKFLIVFLFGILAIIVFGLVWFFVGSGGHSPVGLGWYLFGFAAGLSMIVLPCTLPLAFVIVPLSMGKGPAKGFFIAIAFGLGVAITLSLYGVLAAVIGKVAIGSLGAPLEVVKNWLYFIAGAFAYLFALGELGLVKYRMPSYSGAFPAFIQKQQDVLKALLLGLFLGNIGVGCPHPATPVILTRIAVSGDVFYGWLLFFVHAIGRVLPLIFLAILGIIGVNALQGLLKHKEKIERATGWGMIFVASFILVLGLFSHDWWVLSGQHTLLEEITQEERFLSIISQRLGVAAPHTHGPEELVGHTGLFGLPLSLGTWVLLFLWILPFWWFYNKKKKETLATAEIPEKDMKKKTLSHLFWNFVTLSLLLIVVFGYTLPTRFVHQAAVHAAEEGRMENVDAHMDGSVGSPQGGVMDGGHDVDHSTSFYHEEEDVKEGIVVNLSHNPSTLTTGEAVKLSFYVINLPKDNLGFPGIIPESQLEVQHEKKMHVIGVRKDLNEFFHIHPVADTPSSNILRVEHIFDRPGDYKIWSEIKYNNEDHAFGHPLLAVGGAGASFEPKKEILQNVIVGEGYQVAIDYHDGLAVGPENHLDFIVKDLTGNGVEFENFLGEKMHFSVISEDLTQFIHTHPDSEMGENHHVSFVPKAFANGGEEHGSTGSPQGEIPADHIGFTVPFKKEGFYKVFAQFRPLGIELSPDDALLAEFWIKVDKAPPQSIGGLNPWWRNLIVSLVLIALLSWIVKKYITVPK